MEAAKGMKLRSGNRTLTDAVMADGDSSETMEQKKLDRTISIFGKRISYILLIIHINMAIYAGCFFIQAGTLPYLSKRLGVDVTMFGYLQTMFAVVQLCGGPLFGRFGDLFGGRAALTLAFASAGLSYGLMGLAYSFPMLLLSRLPSIFMHAMQGGQMVVTDMTDSEKRADALGKLGVSYGIGMVIGPFIGGIVNTHLGENEAALVACGGSIVSMLMCYLLLPVKTKKSQTEAQATQEKQVEGKAEGSAVFDLKKIISLLKGNPRAMQLLAVKTVTGIPLGIFQSMFAVFAMETFKLAADQNGYIMSYIGILSMLIQGFGIGIMTKHFTENTLIKWASFILIWSWLLMSFVQNVWQLMVVMVPKCFGLVILNVVVSSTLTKTVSDADTGTMLGLNMAVHSLVGTISPTIGGIIMAKYGFKAISYLGVVASSLVFVALASQSTSGTSPSTIGTMLGINMATNSLIRTVSPTIGGLMLHHWGFASFGYLGCVTSICVSIYLFTKIKH